MIGEKKTVGIIAEYNPFHKGHQYHIEESRRVTGAEYVVVVMSGDFVQRGDPAIVNKYVRARAALENGADLVVELPMVYATGSAQYFARGAVSLLHSMGCIDVISFGSEGGKTDLLQAVSEIVSEEPKEYQIALQHYLSQGNNYPKARFLALQEYMQGQENLQEILTGPNNILALEYLQAIQWLHSDMEAVAIARRSNAYHDLTLGTSFSSASAIRHSLQEEKNEREAIAAAVGNAASLLFQAYDAGETVVWPDLLRYLNYNYLYQHKYLEKYYGMNLELARRMEHNYKVGMNYETMMQKLHSKNMTDTAIRRALLHVVTQTEEAPFLVYSHQLKTPYIRVLGLRKEAGPLLKSIREKNPGRVIQKPMDGMRGFTGNVLAKWMYRQDIMASELYEQICAAKNGRMARSEMEQPQIII